MGKFGIVGKSGSRLSKSSGTLEMLIHAVCERSIPRIESRLVDALAPMSAAELQGYIRARAYEVIRTHADECASSHQLTAEMVGELFQRALERTVQLIARDQKNRRL